jgi:hypothetical protein
MAAGTALAANPENQTFHIAQVAGKEIETPVTTFHVGQGYQEPAPADNISGREHSKQTHAADILPFRTSAKELDSASTFVASVPVAVDPRAQLIIRAHFAETVLSALKSMQQYSGQAMASSYANRLFRVIRQFRDLSPFEPYVEILMALYDAMAFENKWIDYEPAQYESAYKILKTCAAQKLDNSKISKAILKLQRAGFDTIPFGSELDSSAFDDQEEENQQEESQRA